MIEPGESAEQHIAVREIAVALIVVLSWIGALVAAPVMNRSSSVTVLGRDRETLQAIARSSASVVATRGELMLVTRSRPDLARDLWSNGAAFVVPDDVFAWFGSNAKDTSKAD